MIQYYYYYYYNRRNGHKWDVQGNIHVIARVLTDKPWDGEFGNKMGTGQKYKVGNTCRWEDVRNEHTSVSKTNRRNGHKP